MCFVLYLNEAEDFQGIFLIVEPFWDNCEKVFVHTNVEIT